ncbi:DUF2975 domain-containing protein [Jonesiaceae bacterium BS-20]|uniref:DUF2975 domain-containing protein n=1 Tax=Jonesiaceae bacterium BS-20 TaxID=3120821 RepID=A0AAU7DWJ7_9MICO
MSKIIVLVLRITLVFFLLSAVLAQVLVPSIAADVGKNLPELQHLVVPYAMLAIIAILIFQVAIIAVWKLTSLVTANSLFTPAAPRLCKVILICAAAATALSTLVFGHLILIENNGGPGAVYMLVIGLFVGVAIALTMYVLGQMLDAATREHNELKEVI